MKNDSSYLSSHLESLSIEERERALKLFADISEAAKKNLQQYTSDSIPYFKPTIFFDEETCKSINWKVYYPF
jgi:hypothetical protein